MEQKEFQNYFTEITSKIRQGKVILKEFETRTSEIALFDEFISTNTFYLILDNQNRINLIKRKIIATKAQEENKNENEIIIKEGEFNNILETDSQAIKDFKEKYREINNEINELMKLKNLKKYLRSYLQYLNIFDSNFDFQKELKLKYLKFICDKIYVYCAVPFF